MKTTRLEELTQRIEQAIAEHMGASQQAAIDAVVRAFVSTSKGPARAPRRRSARRRASEEIAALSTQLYRAVCEKPGETMAVLAAAVGVTPRELELPMAQLKRLDQVRSVGAKQHMRYYPLAVKA